VGAFFAQVNQVLVFILFIFIYILLLLFYFTHCNHWHSILICSYVKQNKSEKKDNVGRVLGGQWDRVCRDSREGFLVVARLMPIIKEHIRPWTIIVWRAYKGNYKLRFDHYTLNHNHPVSGADR
jgi:hypothetical protein